MDQIIAYSWAKLYNTRTERHDEGGLDVAPSSINTNAVLPHTWTPPLCTLVHVRLGGGAATTHVCRGSAGLAQLKMATPPRPALTLFAGYACNAIKPRPATESKPHEVGHHRQEDHK